MNVASYDLHLHTCWSYDALAEPASYLRRADELGMRVLAITEHHVTDSQDEVRQAAKAYPHIRVIPAAELTVETSTGSVDLVCLGMPSPAPPAIQRVLDAYHQWQRACGEAIVRGLRALGFDWTERQWRELLESYRPPRTIAVQGYTHVKNQVLRDHFKQRGFIATDEEYWPLMHRAMRAASAPPYPAAEAVVPALKDAGVLVVIAHPHGYFDGGDRQRMDALRDQCRLDGIECAHPGVPADFTPHYRAYCVEHGLVSTAGTDCHTADDVQNKLGAHGGPEEWIDEVLARLNGRPSSA